MSKPIKLLIISIFLNFVYICLFLRDPITPIFIYGNTKIFIFSISLFTFFIVSKILSKSFENLSFFRNLSIYHLFSSIMISGLISILFWSLFPTIIDRSLSVNVLGTLYQADKSLTFAEINNSLYKNYMDGDYQAKKRIQEQLKIGNIDFSNNMYLLTKKGKRWAKFNISLARFFGLDKKSALPKN